jgi:hypothetical protein
MPEKKVPTESKKLWKRPLYLVVAEAAVLLTERVRLVAARGIEDAAGLEERLADVRVDKLDRPLRFDAHNCRQRLLWHDVTAVEQAASHCNVVSAGGGASRRSARTAFALARIALGRLVAGFEAGEGHLSQRVLLVDGLGGREQRHVGGERKTDAREAARD